jgi:hypothetical protein
VYNDKPAWSVVIADECLPDIRIHSAAEDISELSADVVETDDLLGQLDVITEITWSAKVRQDVDNMLLLTQKLLSESFAALLALLLGSQLDDLGALLTSLFG